MTIRVVDEQIDDTEGGVALMASAVVATLFLGFGAAVVSVYVALAVINKENEDSVRTFYFAEAAIASAMYEIGQNVDPDQDGVGTRSAQGPGWSYTVTSTALGGGLFQLDATATVGKETTSIQTIVSQVVTSKFPGGAVSFVGDIEKSKIKFKKDPNIVMHGVDSPAVCMTVTSAMEELAEDFYKAIDHGDLLAENFTGSESNYFDKKGKVTTESDPEAIEMPIAVDEDYPVELEDMDAVYDELTDRVYNTLLPNATVIDQLSGDHVTFGTAESPATIYLPDKKTRVNGQTLSGYGTLIVNELDVREGAVVDWQGDIFVIGSDSKKAKLNIDSKKKSSDAPARFELDGNLVVLGQANEDAEFKLKNGAEAIIHGSVFVGTANVEGKGKKAKFKVEKGGDFQLDGLLTLVGRKVEAKFKDDSSTVIHGAVQIAMPDSFEGGKKGKGSAEEIKFEFSGDLVIIKDMGGILDGAKNWDALSEKLNASQMGIVLKKNRLEKKAWGFTKGKAQGKGPQS